MPRQTSIALASALALLLIGTLSGSAWAQTGQNILMIIADDIGVDMIGAYEAHEYPPPLGEHDVPPTPTIDSLADQGLLFLNTWSNPLCATTRATIQTGRYAYRTGVNFGQGTLPDEEFSIPEILSQDPALNYTYATFGKWGLAWDDEDPMSPIRAGYDLFMGDPSAELEGGPDAYFNWTKYIADSSGYTTVPDPGYATTENVDDTIEWITTRDHDQPWFVILSFNAPHAPFHAPPATLHGFPLEGVDCNDENGKTICYRAMIEAMDSEMMRLFKALWPGEDEDDPPVLPPTDTTILFLGDNGSPKGMAREPFQPERAKQTVYEGGVNVPLIIAGAGVSGTPRVSEALTNTSDLFMTVLELAGVDPNTLPTNLPDNPDNPLYNGQAWEHDSFSLVPILADSVDNIREYAYAGYGAIRNRAGYKLIRKYYNTCELYDLNADPFEETNLVNDLVDPSTCKLLAHGLLDDPEAEAAFFDLSQKLDLQGTTNLLAANLDFDADAVADYEDNCSEFVNQDQRDTNQDGYGNACDADYDNDGYVNNYDLALFQAVADPDEGEPDYHPDMDCDGNGIINLSDFGCFLRGQALGVPGPSGLTCAGDPEHTGPCIADDDKDGVRNKDDNCKAKKNPDQRDTNWDGYGNACDADYDNDGYVTYAGNVDPQDSAAFDAAHPSTEGDANYDPDIDCDGDGEINDSDEDCFLEGQELGRPGPSGLICSGTAPCVADDGDGVPTRDDNCAAFANADQLDTNQDGYGNACDADYDNDGDVDGADLALFQAVADPDEGEPDYHPDMDCDGDGIINLSDFSCFLRGQALGEPGPSGLACAGTVSCVDS